MLRGQEIKADRWRFFRIGRFYVNGSGAFRTQHIDVHGNAAALRDTPFPIDHFIEEWQHRNRRIRGFQPFARAEIHANGHSSAGKEAITEKRVFRGFSYQAPAARIVIEGGVAGDDFEFHARRVMIAQILPNAFQRMHRRNAMGAEQIRLANARQFQQFRRIDGAGADNHLSRRARFADFAIDAVAHAKAASAFQYKILRKRALFDGEIGPSPRRVQIGEGSALPPPLRDGHLRHADTFLPHPVQIRVIGQSDLAGRFDHFFKQGHLMAWRIGNTQRAISAAQRVIAAIIAFHALEDGQNIIPTPTAITQLRPVVIILRLAAHEHHAIDGRCAAQHLAARYFNAPPA